MSASWNWPGSRWWRLDLHTHSPASYDFHPESDRVAQNWDAWVDAAIAAGLDAVALTDHNTPDGVDGIQAASISRPLTVFPGVEVTVGGIHLLCILDPACKRDQIVALLTKLGIESERFGETTATSNLSICQAIDIATQAGAIVIAAHVNGPKGLIATLPGEEKLKALRAKGLIAAEVSPAPQDREGWLHPENPGFRSWLEGGQPSLRAIPQIWCSDGHAHSELGRRFTWVKMTRADSEGLRLALLDGADSLQTAENGQQDDPNQHADYVIEEISVRQAKFMGRSADSNAIVPLVVRFNPWLNAVIGARGTGKSTLIDLCRATLRRENELSTGEAEGSLRAAFDRRMQVPKVRGSEGLLTAATVVEVTYRMDGERFVIAWDPRGESTPISRLSGEQRIAEEGDISQRFPVRIYSQKQLFDLARDPNALLGVIDDSDFVRGAELAKRCDAAAAKYLSLRSEARALRTGVDSLPARVASLADIRRKLELLQRGGQAKSLHDYRLRNKDNSTWESIQKSSAEAIDAVARAADQRLGVADLGANPPEPDDHATAALVRSHEQLRHIIAELQATVTGAVDAARAAIEHMQESADALAWRDAVASSEAEYRQVAQRLASEGIANPDEYRNLVQRAATIEKEITALESQRMAADERDAEAAKHLDLYRQLRGDLTTKRREFASSTSSELIRVGVRGLTRHDDLESLLRNSLGIASFDNDYRALAERIAPAAGDWDFRPLDLVVAEMRAILTGAQQTWNSRDKRFEKALRGIQPERVDRIALYCPADLVEVEFRDPRSTTSRWQTLAQGSPGQQTAALLAFVLGHGSEPILLDQPEDDLDNTLIYELLVKRLREQKQKRQVIVVTHNPNIVVHGDAELVVSLEARGGQTHIRCCGGLQEQQVRDEICRVMEGGRSAFESRYRRIVLSGAPHRD